MREEFFVGSKAGFLHEDGEYGRGREEIIKELIN